MKMILPTSITDAMLSSCTVAENDYTEWNSGTSYSIGDYCIVVAVHKIYKALTANSNKYPPDNSSDWQDMGATNRWAMFDQKVGTATTATETFTVELDAGLVTGIGLININALTAQIVMTDPTEGEIYNQTLDLYDPQEVSDWYSYFFEDIGYRTSLVVEGLPSYRSATLEVTITGETGEDVSLGALVVGQLATFAEAALLGSGVGLQDYSRKETDDFGNYVVVERAFSKRASLSFIIANADLDNMVRKLAAVRAIPAVYIGASDYDSTIIYGFYRDFDTVIAYPNESEVSIEIEGLT